ncbi:NADPH-dependent ferric siderophore reductase [Pseudoroseomonas deserti]|uniref:NADPH-dependent ferric siderophore reductase n=1 Tax=Teichococcus deserti TaxID=1817963 RepID=A0A1V2H0T9_9PROT|nr:siderophore-interacting protein [Pseudoroseomonas deserti]ONG50972.1 NADPH-dependent ferric siderophore reductase [Pseudoroseomonas deserti]
MNDAATPDPRATERRRHPIRLRRLAVLSVEDLSPSMRRVTLGGPELEGFVSLGFDDHVKLFFLAPGQDAAILPQQGPDGLVFPTEERPLARDYTPRRFDPVAQTLVIDFALHEAGPATAWALQAAPGQTLLTAGPRGSMVIPTAFDWHLLVGDETALPAIGRRLEELPAGSRALVVAEVEGPGHELPLPSAAQVTVVWSHRRRTTLAGTLREVAFPEGDFFAWVAAESVIAKELRALLVAEKGANPRWTKAAGYWKRGAAGVHDSISD